MQDVRFSIGDTITQAGLHGRPFAYRLVQAEPYTRRNGAETFLLTWEGRCAICGETFVAKSGRKPQSLVRTCTADRNTPRHLWPEVADG